MADVVEEVERSPFTTMQVPRDIADMILHIARMKNLPRKDVWPFLKPGILPVYKKLIQAEVKRVRKLA